ncbi:MAG: B12-binding domain-containing radical SAM protein [Bacteroidota bacterium]
MKILFSHSYVLTFDPKQVRAMQPYPPLATLYAASLAKSLGHEVKVHDVQFDSNEKKLMASVKNFNPDVLVFWDDGFNYLTKMCLSNMRDFILHVLQLEATKTLPVWICSSDSSDHPELYLQAGAQLVITGEGEATLRDLLTFYPNYLNTQGIVHAGGRNPKRPVIKLLDELPLPDYRLIDINSYRNRWKAKHGFFSINMVTTRGCPFSCNWCAKPIYGNRYHAHSPAWIVSQLKQLITDCQPDHIWFADDIFGLKPGWVKEFADLLEKENILIPFKIQSRVDLLLNENAVQHLARAGCDTVWVGAESGSQKILDAMDKGTLVEQIAEATHQLHKAGMKVGYFLQFGYPGEELADIQLTLRMLEENKPDDIGVSVSYPLPGTSFYDKVKSELNNKANWTDSDDLSLMFSNTYPGSFYKALHRYLHKKFRLSQSLRQTKNIIRNKVDFLLLMKEIMRTVYYCMVLPYYKLRWYASR